jgi:lipopolysaccharide transport system permease protein
LTTDPKTLPHADDSDDSNRSDGLIAAQGSPDGEGEDHDELSSFEIEVSNEVTVYSAESEIRAPVKLFRGIATDFWRGRELAWRLFLRNIRGLYRQTLLGLFWAILPPIANTAVWVFLRQMGVFKMEEGEVNGTIYILAGMVLWQAFIDAFQMPSKVVTQNKNMISKLRFSRESLLLVGLGEVLFDFAIRMALLIPAMIFFGVPWHATMLLAPIAVAFMVMFSMSLGLLIMPFGSLYQDVGRFISLVLPFWMILTPIIYVVPSGHPLTWLNPASPLLLLSRDWMLLGTSGSLGLGLAFAVLTVPLFLVGLAIYRVSIPVLVERMNA